MYQVHVHILEFLWLIYIFSPDQTNKKIELYESVGIPNV